jgi:class 3 adenylate cyclase
MNPSRSEKETHPNGKKSPDSARTILINGVLWRILFIEGILLVWSVGYRWLYIGATVEEILWYTLRIIVLIAIIVLFLMFTLRRFLKQRIIHSLEAIARANLNLDVDKPDTRPVVIPPDAPKEIQDIVSSRTRMLDAIVKVSEERLGLVNFIRDTFGRYLSKKIVDEILASPEGRKIGGRRKTVTILMSDLRGFTGLSEILDPESIVDLLNRYLESMSEVILSYDGIIDEFIGDAILAVFGVPDSREDDAPRAVACALSMQNKLSELNQELAREGFPPLEMGIGVNTGNVVVGNIGSKMRAKYGLIGSTVNIAGRIESYTTGGQVIIGEPTYNAVKSLVTTEAPITMMMKGLKRPLAGYPVTAIGPPYDVAFLPPQDIQAGVALNLPFHFWMIREKEIEPDAKPGETVLMGDNFITAKIIPAPEPMANIKLHFDLCTDLHCFEDIYAKVMTVENEKGQPLTHLRITYIDKADKDILSEWMKTAE